MKVFIEFFLLFAILHCEHNAYGTKKIWKGTVRYARQNEFGYVVSIGLKSNVAHVAHHICSGVLISKKHVLTSAHCINEVNRVKDVRVKLGSNDLNDTKIYKIKTWITYELWARDNNIIAEQSENDISILKLNKEVDSLIVDPAVLTNRKNHDFYVTKAKTVVWSPRRDERIARFLKVAVLDVISYDECVSELNGTRLLPANTTIEPVYLCTHLNLGAVLENIDSGAPLLNAKNKIIAINDPTYLQRKGIPIPTNLNFHIGIDYYRDFITSVIQTRDATWWQNVWN